MEQTFLDNLCSKAKIDRDKGFLQIVEYLENADVEAVLELQKKFTAILADSSAPWETKHGILMASKAVCRSQHSTEEFCSNLVSMALQLAEDPEFRVRIAAGEVIGELCKKLGVCVFLQCKDVVMEGISSNLERDIMESSFTDQFDNTENLIEKLSTSPRGERRSSADAAQIFHDTAGWKSLETWMKCLQSIIDGCGKDFNPYVDQELLDLIFKALTNTNRFVRETGFYVCSSLVACGHEESDLDSMMEDDGNTILRFGHQLAEYLARGLADNWSQVRLASSVATRRFLECLPSEEARHQFYPVLLPRMCLNRYYVAEGVRIYSQNTWKQITLEKGKELVEQYIASTVEYYIEATGADNHAVREAACACIAELGAKMQKSVVQPHIPILLDALLICFNDDSWPVRDAACVACGNFVLCFPDESRGSLPALYPLFFNNLQDNIPSVRQGAALALAHVVKAYGEECFSEILQKVKEGLTGVEKQPENTEKYSSLEKGPATYGVAKRLRDNDMELHTDKQMYSCGSLAPKMGRGPRDGGCMDHKFRKEPEPWELADGCIHLMADLSQQPKFAPKVAELLPLLSKAAGYQHYTHHPNLKESLCQRLPHIANGLGKRYFKMYLEMFFDAIFYSLTCDNALTSAAAHTCLSELSKFLGPSILRGRVEQYNPRYLDQLPPDLGFDSGPGLSVASPGSGFPFQGPLMGGPMGMAGPMGGPSGPLGGVKVRPGNSQMASSGSAGSPLESSSNEHMQ